MTQTALAEQLAKLNPKGAGAQLLDRVRGDQAAATVALATDDATPGGGSLLDALDSEREARDYARSQHEAALEAQYGQFGTAATQFARGATDALLGPGALAAAGIETLGSATGWEGAERFGRQLGEASSGSAAFEALAFASGASAFGKKVGIDNSLRVRKYVDESAEAWPMLSAVSRASGGVAAGLATGGLGSAGAAGGLASSGRAVIGVGAFEGASGGAQAAYERNASLRDVLSSTLVGGALGAGLAGAGVGVTALLKSPALKRAARELAAESSLKATGARGSDIRAALGRADGAAAERRIQELGDELLNYRDAAGQRILRAGDKAEDLAPRLSVAREEVGEKLGAIKSRIDEAIVTDASLAPDVNAYLKKIDDEVIAPLRSSLVPAVRDRAKAVEKQLSILAERQGGGEFADIDSLGVENLNYLRSGMRDMASIRKAYAGVSAEEAEKIALGQIAPKGAKKPLEPIVVEVYPDTIALNDGRHRLLAATEAGAENILAKVRRLDEEGNLVSETLTPLSIKAKAQSPVTFGEIDKLRSDLRSVFQPSRPEGGGVPPPVPDSAEALEKAERILADELNNSAERSLEALGADTTEFARLRKSYSNLATLDQLTNKAAKQDLGNRSLSPSDYLTGIGAASSALTGGVSTIASAAQGLLGAIAHKVVRERARATIALLADNIVLDSVRPAVERVLPMLERGAIGTATRSINRSEGAALELAPMLTREEKQERYQSQLATVTKAVTQPDFEAREKLMGGFTSLPAPLVIAASGDMQARLEQLAADMPKPEPNIRGKAFETLSSDQVRLANAMYEATTAPMSVFDDFASGNLDYDKVQYAWKQYPGLKEAAQAGLMDALSLHITEDTRAAIPDATLSQLDFLFGFGGELQPTVNAAFAARMSEASAAEQQQRQAPNNSGPLNLPTSKPTFTQRLSGAQ